MIKVLAIVGPTAVGKSALGISLATKLGGEIVSADSMQVYCDMDIGTAKPSPEERQIVPHHLIDVVETGENFSVAEYQRLARDAISEINGRGRLPFLVGGSGLYVRAVVDQLDFPAGHLDTSARQHLESRVAAEGVQGLYADLERLDPDAAARIHPNNARRIIRALEVWALTGEPFSEFQKKWSNRESIYELTMVGLMLKPEKLCAKIEKRVDAQLEAGLLDEVRSLVDKDLGRALTGKQALGYKELLAHLAGEASLDEAIARIKTRTCRLAKAQRTWFRRDPRIYWIDTESKNDREITDETVDYLKEAFSIGSS